MVHPMDALHDTQVTMGRHPLTMLGKLDWIHTGPASDSPSS